MKTGMRLCAVVVVGALGTGCAANGYVPGEIPDGSARLEIIGPSTVQIPFSTERDVQFRYVSHFGEPLAGTVSFDLRGATHGATLAGNASLTDATGIATARVRSADAAQFELVATAPNAQPATVSIRVARSIFGTINYIVEYTGPRFVDTVEVGLFSNTTCTMARTTPPAPRATQMTRLHTRNAFVNVESGIPLAVFALGIDRRNAVAAEACVDMVLDAPVEELQITLGDLLPIVAGVYNVVDTFDVTSGLNPVLDETLEALRGLSEDPARYLVDFVAEHDSGPTGDALRVPSVATAVAGLLRAALNDIHLPESVVAIGELGADLDRALSAMALRGDLAFDVPDEFGAAAGRHRVHTLAVPVDMAVVERPILTMADVRVEVTLDTLTVPEHALTISFGQLLEVLLHEILLPRLPGSPHSLGQLLGNVCDAIVGETSSTLGALGSAACDIGAALIGTYFEGRLLMLAEYDTLYVSESGHLIDSDSDYDLDTVEQNTGSSVGRWVGASGTMGPLSGTFTGARLDDRTGRVHAVRDRMWAVP